MRRPDLLSRLVIARLGPMVGTPPTDIPAARRLADRAPLPRWLLRLGLAGLSDLEVDGEAGRLPARLYRPRRARGLVLYLHGGGFVFCGLDSYDLVCALLARASGATVLSVAYRLAPEHPFPAAWEDGFAAYRWLLARAGALGRGNPAIVVAGDSAGGTLAAAIALMARDRGETPPCAQLLYYPALTGDEPVPSRAEFASGFFLTEAMMRWFRRQVLGGRAHEPSPYYMPALAADLSGLPPALVVTAAFDPLRDEGELYARRLREAGVPVRLGCIPGAIHGFLSFALLMPKARRVLRDTGRAVRNLLDRTMLPG